MHHNIVHVRVVGTAVFVVHSHIEQAFACLAQARRCGVVLNAVVLEIVEPFFKWSLGYVVELVDAYDVIFGKNILGCTKRNFVPLSCVDFQLITSMDAREDRAPMIEIVLALPEVEVQDIDRIDFLYIVVFVAYLDMLRDCFRHTVEHALQII